MYQEQKLDLKNNNFDFLVCQNFKRLDPLHVIKFQVCSCNIASLRAGEPPSVREPQVTEAVTWGSLLKF